MNSDDFILSGLSSVARNIPFTKSGAGVLTLDLGLGVQNDGPVSLNILEGEVLAVGVDPTSQLNVGGSTVIDGVLTLDGPILMLHGAIDLDTGLVDPDTGPTVTGTG